ncbi:MAG TPA: phosphopantetheine-binding protein [Nitrospirales bacterium]|nr:phosphopantetheine-binding protein [Nitrospirales bacterium]
MEHECIQLDVLPLNTNGKVDINTLSQPESVRHQLHQPFVFSRNEMESHVTEIIRRVVGFDRIGVKDDFYDLGGDSLMATQTVNRLSRSMNVQKKLTPRSHKNGKLVLFSQLCLMNLIAKKVFC